MTAEAIAAPRLTLAWIHRPVQAPQPAWPEPARWDAHVKRMVISSMRNYDESFHLAIVGGSVYYGSSADDSVHCLDAHTGREQWTFTVDGPIRAPPTVQQGRLYFGSDDGCAYCISADTGGLIWKYRPGPSRLVLNDGRLISQWPCRTGVMLLEGIAYVGASLLPWEPSYLAGVNAKTGLVEGKGTFVKKIDRATLEGTLLAADDHLIATQGRAAPLWFSRAGVARGLLSGVQGGSFALISAEGNRYFGPGPKEGFVSESDASHKAVVARKVGALALVAAGDSLYVLEPRVLGRLRTRPEEWVWRRPSDMQDALIMAGDTLFLGGKDKVQAARLSDGAPIWQLPVEGRAQGLAVANGTLFVSTDRGLIYAFREAGSSDAAPALELPSLAPVESTYHETVGVSRQIRRGPFLDFTDPETARVRWETKSPCPTVLTCGIGGVDQRNQDDTLRTKHEIVLNDLKPKTVYNFSIILPGAGEELCVGPLECDTHMNFTQPPTPKHRDPFIGDPTRDIARSQARLFSRAIPRKRGLVLILGARRSALAYYLALETQLNILILEPDAATAAETRERLQPTGLYGSRLSVLPLDRGRAAALPNHFANAIVLSGSARASSLMSEIEESLQLLKPGDGQLFVPATAKAHSLLESKPPLGQLLPEVAGLSAVGTEWLVLVKAGLPGAAPWTHQYGRGDNATYNGETLASAQRTTDFDVQWIGRPGPRFQSDRQNRKPAPLCAAGVLYVPGLDRILAMDAYNGSVLWSREIPDSRRFNIRHDSSNWCADDRRLYLAVRDACWSLDANTGELAAEHVIPQGSGESAARDWGFVGREGRMLVGSETAPDASYKHFWGGQFWYTDPEGPLAAHVCSSSLFALDAASGKPAWKYRGGAIVNTSITLAAGAVFFAECRGPGAAASLKTGRSHSPELWKDVYLVSLELATGRIRWERPSTSGPAMTMFSLAHSKNSLVAVASARGNYRVSVYRASDGKPKWETTFSWEASGKGGDSGRPAIVDGKLFISPRAFDLSTGTPLPIKVVRGACGTYAAGQGALISRIGNLGLWCPEAGVATTWDRLRPDCWMSAIPAAGMLLAPEGGGGCSCGGWLETSIAFIPKATRVQKDSRPQKD